MNKTDSIVIVGGGSAGWMSAATLISLFPNKKITVVESPDVPIVGVGESTLGHIKDWLTMVGIKEEDFIAAVDGSYKMSIKFTNFYDTNSGSFHYPFGIPYLQGSPLGLNSWFLYKYLNPNVPVENFAENFFPAMQLINNNRFNENKDGEFDNFRPETDVAYHFDAIKFGAWLRDNFCRPRGVMLISDTVEMINKDSEGITGLVTKNGTKIHADLFIDCTGFKSLLLSETLEEPFDSFEHILPNNRAWATRIPYIDKEKELEPYTNCTALGHGWVWNIPLWSRIGTGYVYSDKYIDPEIALEEFKAHLRSKNMTVPDENRINDSLEFKDIKFRVGIHKRTWVKNVVAIGLSSGFIEPLESNGLYTVHEFLRYLCKSIQRGKVSQWDRDVYNASTRGVFENFAQFVALHYALSRREDTRYWRDISERSFSKEMANLLPTKIGTFENVLQEKMFNNEYPHNTGPTYICAGMNYSPVDNTVVPLWELRNNDNYPELNTYIRSIREPLIDKWKKAASESSSLYGYLLNKYYIEEELKKDKPVK